MFYIYIYDCSKMKEAIPIFQLWLGIFWQFQVNNNILFLSYISYINFLIYTGISVPIERVFSGGSDLITKRRSSLNQESIRACMCLKNWIRK